MGFVLSKFRKEKSTEAVLEGLEIQIQDLSKFLINTQERKRRFVTNFLGITIGTFIVGFGLWCCFYFPPKWKDRVVFLIPMLLFPIIIVLMRQMFTWYFQRKLNKNGDKLAQLKEKKKKILEQVMEKENYKVAVNLLERFGDKKLNQSFSRSAAMQLPRTPQPAARLPGASTQQRSLTPYSGVYRNANNNNPNSSTLSTMSAPTNVGAVQEIRRRTPFPVVDQNRSRSAVDRIVDFIVGDTPIRYGMICKECDGHNGMLPEDEFYYTSFRCAYCHSLNPARKQRPVAPRLSINEQTPASNIDSSGSDSSDDYDSDKEQLTRRALLQDVPSNDTDKEEARAEAEANPNAQSGASVTGKGEMETESTETAAEEAAGVVVVDRKSEAEEAPGSGVSEAEAASSS